MQVERRSLELSTRQWAWLEERAEATLAVSRRGPTPGQSSWRVFISDWINAELKKSTEVTFTVDRNGTWNWLTEPGADGPVEGVMDAYIDELQRRTQKNHDDCLVHVEYAEDDETRANFDDQALLDEVQHSYNTAAAELAKDWSWYDAIVESE